MIPILRGPEPPELTKARRKHLARAILARHHMQDIDFTGYDVAKKGLGQAQWMKCAYCERPLGLEGQPVEHFRPKDGVARDPEQPKLLDKGYYWWLAWSWENLLLSCVSCNSLSRKGNKFPLVSGTAPLQCPPAGLAAEPPVACFDLSIEKPLLLDPGYDDPRDHIEWRPENPADAREEDFLWRPFHKSERGAATVRILGLRGGLVDQVSEHIRGRVLRRLQLLRREIEHGSLADARSDWIQLCRELFTPGAPFQAASFDALKYLVPRWYRERWMLTPLERPSKPKLVTAPCPVATDPPSLNRIPDDVRLHVRADKLERDALLRLLFQHREWKLSELATALELADSTLRASLRGLVNAGTLQYVGGQYSLRTP